MFDRFDLGLVLDSLALACLPEFSFDKKSLAGCYWYYVANSIVVRVSKYIGLRQVGLVVCEEVCALFKTEWTGNRMMPDFVDGVLRRYKETVESLHST